MPDVHRAGSAPFFLRGTFFVIFSPFIPSFTTSTLTASSAPLSFVFPHYPL